MSASCDGLGDEHCCWLDGKECAWLERGTVEGRDYACGFYRRLGSWAAVAEDDDYKLVISPRLARFGLAHCGEWPKPGETCAACGKVG